jgi:hypothetical protein
MDNHQLALALCKFIATEPGNSDCGKINFDGTKLPMVVISSANHNL